MPGFRRLLATSSTSLLGTFVKIPAPEVVEMVAGAGFDFVVIDTEHALLSVRDVYGLVVLYSRMGVVPLVRVADHGYGDGQRYLDAGAGGLLVPHVSDRAQATAVTDQFRFPPHGTRGMGFAARAGRWGSLPGGPAAYVAAGEEDVARVMMIEEQGAVDRLEEIVAVPGVDAIFVGPGDLSLSMGVPLGSDELERAVGGAIATAVAAGVAVGTVAEGDQVRVRAEQGCAFVLVGNDAGLFDQCVRRTVAAARDAVGATRPAARTDTRREAPNGLREG